MENDTAKRAAGRPDETRLESRRIAEMNDRALAGRPFLQPGYKFLPASTHNARFHELKSAYPYFGYIDVEIEGVKPFVMFSSNDDRVAQTYFWYGPNAFESFSLRLWRELARRSNGVFDVGAFTGVYSLAAQRANEDARVYSFEPVKRVFGRLLDNLKANRLGQKVRAFDLALGDADGETAINLYHGHGILSSGSSLVPKEHGEVFGREHVRTMRLDAFVEEHGVPEVNLMKIDVEGAEKLVVDGMRNVLREHRPDLLVEVLPGENLREILGALSPHGYNFAVIDENSQQAYVNDPEAHTKTYNVLFSTMPAAELRDFCLSVGPLPRAPLSDGRGAADALREYRDHHEAVERLRETDERLRGAREQLREKDGHLQRTSRRLRETEERLRRLRREMDEMQGSRGWRVANAINAAAIKARGLLKRG